MGLIGALTIGAVSGAGQGIANVATEDQKAYDAQTLVGQQAQLEMMRDKAAIQAKLEAENQQAQTHATTFMNAAQGIAQQNRDNLIQRLGQGDGTDDNPGYDLSDTDQSGNPTGTTTPLTYQDLDEGDQAKVDAITPYDQETITAAGLKTGLMTPDEAGKLKNNEASTLARLEFWQGRVENAKDRNAALLTIAQMKADYATQSKTALASAIGLVHADISATSSQLNKLQQDRTNYLTNAIPTKDPARLAEQKSQLANYDSQINDLHVHLGGLQTQSQAILSGLGLKLGSTQNGSGSQNPSPSSTQPTAPVSPKQKTSGGGLKPLPPTINFQQ